VDSGQQIEQPGGAASSAGQYWHDFRLGFLKVVPFWIGIAPFSLAFAVAAHAAGFSPIAVLLMAMLVFAGASQMAAVSMFAGGAGIISIVVATLVINLRHVIYGLSLDRHLPVRTQPSRPWMAFLLADPTYGLTMAQRNENVRLDAFYMGVGFGVYIPYTLFTGAGLVLGGAIAGAGEIGLDFVFPLFFISLLVPLLTSRTRILVAAASALAALVLYQVVSPGIAVLVSICAGAAIGTWLERD
jgi:4-azaleucine resistance transporter AzlC